MRMSRPASSRCVERSAARCGTWRAVGFGAPDSVLDGALEHGLVERVAAAVTGLPVNVDACGGEHPLPGPFATGVGVLAGQRPRQLDPSRAVSQVGVVLTLDAFQMSRQVGDHDRRQRRGPVFVALSPAHYDLVAREIDVLHPHARGLEETKASSVEQDRHEPVNAAELTDDGANFVAGQHHGQAGGPLGPDDVVEPRQLLPEHLTVKEEQRTQRLVLGGASDMALDGQGRQEPRHLGPTHLERMPLAMEVDVPADTRDVGLLGAAAVVLGSR